MFNLKKKPSWNDKGTFAAQAIVQSAGELTKSIINIEALDDELAFNLFVFNSALLTIGLDRDAFSYLKETERAEFIDAAYLGVTSGICDFFNIPSSEFTTVANLLQEYGSQLGQYARRLFPDKDDSPKGTLFWEYGKLLVDKFGLNLHTALTASLEASRSVTSVYVSVRHFYPSKKS